MVSIFENTSPWDTFFYYGKGELENEIQYDIFEFLMQMKRTYFYFRNGSGGIPQYENMPSSLLFFIAKYEIASALAYRNTYVSNGSDGSKDRRVAVSQSGVEMSQKDKGEIDIEIKYFMYDKYQNPNINSFPLRR